MRSLTQLDSIINKNFMEVILKKSDTTPRLMPLFHVCTSYAFRSIFNDLKLDTKPCKVFNESLLYFFYGKPAYRVRETNVRDSSMFPVCWGIDANSIKNIVRVFPFDSGAFEEILSKKIADHFELDNFKLYNNLEAVQRFISFFYKTNDNYFFGRPSLNDASIPPQAYELQSLLSLADDRGNSADDRANTIEIQINEPIEIESIDIKILGIPAPLLNDPAVVAFLDANEVNFFTYDLHKFPPSHINSVFYEKTKEHYFGEGIISHE